MKHRVVNLAGADLTDKLKETLYAIGFFEKFPVISRMKR